MTIQECCGSILSSDPNINESDAPFMTRDCYESDDWSLPECSSCCGSSEATCFPTYQGGYCANDGFYYKYKKRPGSSRKERFPMSRNAFLEETPYRPGQKPEQDWPTTNWYNEARYRDMRGKVIQDLQNESMNLGILHQRDPGRIRPLDQEAEPSSWLSPQLSSILRGSSIVAAFLLFALCAYMVATMVR